MKGPGDAGNKAFPDAPNVVGIDLQSDGIVLARSTTKAAPTLPRVSASATEAPPCRRP